MALRDYAAAAAIVALSAYIFGANPLAPLHGLSIDALFWLRHRTLGPLHPPADSPAVVIAIDEETYRRPPFADTPQVMWTPQIAKVLGSVLDAGVKVIGFDIIYPTSVEPYLRGYERDFLLFLRRAAQQDRVVLGRVQHQVKPIGPYRGYGFVVGHGRNIRPLNLVEDEDGVIRRMPLYFTTETAAGTMEREPSLAVELASRAAQKPADAFAPPRQRIGPIAFPTVSDDTILINFDTGQGDIPSYSLADLLACVEAGNTEYFRKHFAGKVVLFGGVLDVEDRKLTSKRLVTAPEGSNLPQRCALQVQSDLFAHNVRRDSIPGVFIHAAAINNLTRQDYLLRPSVPISLAIVAALAAAVAALGMTLGPGAATAAFAGLASVWAAICIYAFHLTLVLPLLPGLGAGGLTFAAVLGYRFGVSDRDRRQLTRAFSLYLPPAVIDRMVRSRRLPELGGELREVSVLFSDIAGFTQLAESRAPTLLVQDLNEYFSEMTSIVERFGGFVDKYVGDAVVAVFGAPVADPSHAVHAVTAALRMQEIIATDATRFHFGRDRPIDVRIGLNSGQVLIGNIGSTRRFNYTVMGDAVNLASRIEGANKQYGSRILVSDDTRNACGQAIAFREIDMVRVLGRVTPVTLFEPHGVAAPSQAERDAAFAAALEHWRSGRFKAAAAAFATLSADDAVAKSFLERARIMESNPPPSWDGITDLRNK